VKNFIIAYEKLMTSTPMMAYLMAVFPSFVFPQKTLVAYLYPAKIIINAPMKSPIWDKNLVR
jgi:hypothetical protein